MKRTALIDGDIAVYKIACAVEIETHWGGGIWTLHSDEILAKAKLDDYLLQTQETLGADRMVIGLTDSVNWRKEVMPSYKSNRKDVRKPLVLAALRSYLHEEYEVFQRPGLEGDDVLGILATSPKLIKGDKVIVSIDKDFKSVPCLLWRGETARGFPVLDEISVAQADRFHMIQALAGDPTDGYPGCPGIGMIKAAEIVDDPHLVIPEPYTVTKGEKKGEAGTRWVTSPANNVWAAIVSHYAKAGLSEADALRNARVARICRVQDYDFKAKAVRLWSPPSI